ncbi:MAG: hypothetical protein JWR84_3786 [Caulobacter sp.]|nr:hypothetical protein [Caulobacter sp.]
MAGDVTRETERDEASRLLAAIRAHPRLDEAIRRSAQGAVELARAPSALTRLYRDYDTHMLMTLALAQHYAGGLTAGRLLGLCQEAGLGSRGRAETLVAQLQDRGGLVAVRARGDRRRHPLVPTPELLAFVHARLWVDVEAAAMVSTTAAAQAGAFEDQDFVAAYYRALTGAVRAAKTPLGALGGGLGPFSDRNGGLLILCDIVERLAALSPSEEVAVSAADWSRRFGVSLSHVRKLLRDAAAQDRVVWRPEARRLSLTAGHIEAMRGFFAYLYFGLTYVLGQAAR